MNRILAYVILTMFLGILYSCNNDQTLLNNAFSKGSINGHHINEIRFKTDSLSYSNEYYKYYDSYEVDNKVYFIGYNSKTHSLDILNISDRGIAGHLLLDESGPNSINGIMGINAISHDSILIADNTKFCIINSEGIIVWKLMRNNPVILDGLKQAYLNTRESFKPGYYQKEKSIILYYNPIENRYAFKLPILIQVAMESPESQLLPFYLPPALKKDISYNPIYRGPRTCFTKDRIILNFASESNIYSYEYLSKKVTAYGGKSSFTKNSLQPLGENENPMDYALTSICFFKLVYDPYKKLFYRTHWGEMKLKKTDFEYNTFYDKPIFLTVFDQNLNYLYETKLEIESGIVPEQLIPTPEGLLVFPFKQKTDDLEKDCQLGYLITFR